ncbi:MAG TPA: hypothetical protein VM493_08410, partial [Vicinamibacterales bacterium]|nr:hypothetical protein [Vicinamibacterales bacterium]
SNPTKRKTKSGTKPQMSLTFGDGKSIGAAAVPSLEEAFIKAQRNDLALQISRGELAADAALETAIASNLVARVDTKPVTADMVSTRITLAEAPKLSFGQRVWKRFATFLGL